MIVNGKHVISGAWTIFQHGPRNWYYCDERSIARGPYASSVTAKRGRWAYARARGLKPDFWPEQRQSVKLGLAGYLVLDASDYVPPPAESPPASPAPPDPSPATTSPTRRAAKRAKGSRAASGSGRGKARY